MSNPNLLQIQSRAARSTVKQRFRLRPAGAARPRCHAEGSRQLIRSYHFGQWPAPMRWP